MLLKFRSIFREAFVGEFIFPEPTFYFFWCCHYLFHDRGPYHIETSPLICRANMIETFVIKELTYHLIKRYSMSLKLKWRKDNGIKILDSWFIDSLRDIAFVFHFLNSNHCILLNDLDQEAAVNCIIRFSHFKSWQYHFKISGITLNDTLCKTRIKKDFLEIWGEYEMSAKRKYYIISGRSSW